jgi:hypothetical protein
MIDSGVHVNPNSQFRTTDKLNVELNKEKSVETCNNFLSIPVHHLHPSLISESCDTQI